MAKSTRTRFGDEGFPLWKHPSGRWCKKVRGRAVYFGRIDADPHGEAAYRLWLDERDALITGKRPDRERAHVNTVGKIVNAYLERCEGRVQSGELSEVSFADYKFVGKLVIEHLGRHTDPERLDPDGFAKFRSALAKRYAPSRLNKTVTVTRQIFKWAMQSKWIPQVPDYGPDFTVASQKVMRRRKAEAGKKLLTCDEVQSLLNAADAKWKAIVLLCLNAGLGNSDVARLKLSDVDGEWLSVPRGKTGIERRAWLWPETREAVQDAIRQRPKPKEGAEHLLFLSGHRGPLMVVRENGKRTDLTVEGFRRLAKQAGIHRHGMGLYWLRHTCATIGDGAKDRAAVMLLMGHSDRSMTGSYVEDIEDERVKAVCEHVRGWLYPPDPKQSTEPSPSPDDRPQLRIVG